VIAFLASQDALFINGVNLAVDGGLHASNGQPNSLLLFGQGTEESSVVSHGAKPATPA
jgi:meso-butanediol dehydrogenase/(S,S)-butanediol dehydrogenase/diacetyl reductase